jgi:hypothetical protein
MPFHFRDSLLICLSAMGIFANPARATAAHFSPALLNGIAELDTIKVRIASGAEPWKSAFQKARTSRFAATSYAATPRDTVACGSYSVPDSGCSNESDDSKAAYTQALLWRFTGDTAYASRSAAILDAWSARLKQHTLSNAPLQAGWTASVFVRAAVILRATYPAWGAAPQAAFARMLDNAFLPLIRNGNPGTNGNWELTYIEAMMAIGVFTADTAAFNKGIFLWRKRVPAYFYLKSDGPLPVKPYGVAAKYSDSQLVAHWYNPQVWPDGLAQETCRDFGHTQMGLAAMIDAAEIALHQGLDLYSEFADRITTAMEFHAGLLLGGTPPPGLCGDSLTLSMGATWEIAYNHFHNRMGRDLPMTDKLIREKIRPSGTGTHMAWESLTHAELGALRPDALRPEARRAPARGAALILLGTNLAWTRDGMVYGLNGKRMPLTTSTP